MLAEESLCRGIWWLQTLLSSFIFVTSLRGRVWGWCSLFLSFSISCSINAVVWATSLMMMLVSTWKSKAHYMHCCCTFPCQLGVKFRLWSWNFTLGTGSCQFYFLWLGCGRNPFKGWPQSDICIGVTVLVTSSFNLPGHICTILLLLHLLWQPR